ncbi:MAG: hypothetical protein QM662_11645 [Gordonia sp. (in: high G+C Gram-positive bacteria)]
MTLLYRAIWRDDRDALGGAVQRLFADWVADRSGGAITVTGPGSHTAKVVTGESAQPSLIEVSCENVIDDGEIAIVRNSYLLTTPDDVRWHTRVRAWTDANGGWCWVDNSVVGDSIANVRKLQVNSPLLVRSLLDTADNPRVGELTLSTAPRHYRGADGAEQLAELIGDFDRTIPLVVFARSKRMLRELGVGTNYDTIAAITAERVAGLAIVAVADEEAAAAVTECLGRDFGVDNGALRIYAREVDPAVESNAYLHRYLPAEGFLAAPERAAELVGQIVGPESTVRRPPPTYDAIKERLNRQRAGTSDLEELLAVVELECAEAQREVITLREENVELLEWKAETARLEAQLTYAKKLLITAGICDDFGDDGNGNIVPRRPTTAAEAVESARKYLSDRVEIHPDALRAPEIMDRAGEGATWAGIAWDGFKALSAYAEFMAENPSENMDFTLWCKSKHNTVGWPETKTARGESGATKKGPAKTSRTFPVSVRVSGNCAVEMFAHLKIALRGNGRIPRIYFLYSPRTKRVHVGFYGPHDLVPNTRS